jgi:DNA-binding response OmpR family regulator
MVRLTPSRIPTHRETILIVEDEKRLATLIQQQLEKEGYAADVLLDGAGANEVISSRPFSLVILDLVLPHKSGYDILSSLRSEGNKIPVLILSGMRRTPDRIKGLQLGADDYLTKPFDAGELLARVQALLRRDHSTHETVLRAEDLVMDVIHRTVTRNGRRLELSPREFRLLEFMLHNKNKIVTRARIAEQVWGHEFDTGTKIVDVYISYLRRAINNGFPTKMLHTLSGEGFILMDNEGRAGIS